MKNRFFLTIISVCLFTLVGAQDNWTLEQCITYAIDNNISISQSELQTKYEANTLQQNKYNRLPDLNASVSQTFSFGRVENQDGVKVSSDASSTGFSIGSSMYLYQGGTLNNKIKQQEVVLLSSLEMLEKAKNDLSIQVAQNFLQILLTLELRKVAEGQLYQTAMQMERTKKLVESGTLAEGALYDIKAQQARERLDSVMTKNNHSLAVLNLAQLLELDDYSNFAIEPPMFLEMNAQISVLKAITVFENALVSRPEIRSAEYDLENSNYDLKLAKSSRLPSLSASAGMSDQFITDYSSNVPSFSDQLSNNKATYIGLNLSVPLFQKFQVRTNVDNAKIQVESQQLNLDAAKKQLRLEIEQAYFNAVAAYQRYDANKIAVASMEESFRYMQKKYELGRVNSVEYNETKTNLAIAQSDLLQAKYEFIFMSKILEFYNGEALTL